MVWGCMCQPTKLCNMIWFHDYVKFNKWSEAPNKRFLHPSDANAHEYSEREVEQMDDTHPVRRAGNLEMYLFRCLAKLSGNFHPSGYHKTT
ncbi:hypothetical protein NPIL_157531 [Nephila pilipes]|uniref:Uncharacterized protein n=1 Tax=Nephila pilipes TaxID=299642 RepID=A0A8X6JIC8_NEPPI|nr:hypothetical protein NPIL_157531 [Nephila pilipes]